ncbi:MAG: Rrf2 family transcriptional regulator [Chloroflexi bacterium]|nr:MAG: Rrf2 family transcriptional regulator [Chloroflexota bacterium]
MSNSRFTVAVHAMTLMATFEDINPEKTPTSKEIARSVRTNPVVIRRILGDLRRAGLVTSQAGVKGGVRLTRSAGEITLCDVYRAVEKDVLLPLHNSPPNAVCPIGSVIGDVLSAIFIDAQNAMEARLAAVTIADVMRDTLEITEPRFVEMLQRYLQT